MVQPKKPPLSVRLPPALLDRIKAEAEAKGLAVNAELVAVLTRAYRLGEKAADLGATPEQLMKAMRPNQEKPKQKHTRKALDKQPKSAPSVKSVRVSLSLPAGSKLKDPTK